MVFGGDRTSPGVPAAPGAPRVLLFQWARSSQSLIEVGHFGGPRSWASILGIVTNTKKWVLRKKRQRAKL